jgi:hypothetical protein
MACQWFTLQEAADWAKVHKTTLQKWVKYGVDGRKLKVSKRGLVVRVCRRELDTFMGVGDA